MKNLDPYLRKKTTTFYKAIKLFPKEKRQDVFLLYFFLRQIDDLVDEVKNKKQFYLAKKDFFDSLKNDKKARYEFNRAILALIKKYHIPKKYFDDFFNAQEKELIQKNNFNDLKDLDQYCYGVAGVVGLMMSRILELDKDLDNEAIIFGNFMQKVNILRDIREDQEKNKLYIPKKVLEKFKINKKNLIKDQSNYILMIRYLVSENKKELAKVSFLKIKWRLRIPLLLAKNTYFQIEDKIEKNPVNYFYKKCSLNFFDWLFIFNKTLIYG